MVFWPMKDIFLVVFFKFNIALSDQTFSTHVCPQRTRNIKQISGNQNDKRPGAVGRKRPQSFAFHSGLQQCQLPSAGVKSTPALIMWPH